MNYLDMEKKLINTDRYGQLDFNENEFHLSVKQPRDLL